MTTLAIASDALSTTPPRARRWTGRVITGLLGAFLLVDAVAKIALVPAVVEASAQMGISAPTISAIGGLLLACLVLHLIPRTAVLGAVLLTGYLGGAICAHVLLRDGAGTIAFALGFGILVWLGLFLRDPRVAQMIAARTKS